MWPEASSVSLTAVSLTAMTAAHKFVDDEC